MFTKVDHQKEVKIEADNASLKISPLLQFHVWAVRDCLLAENYEKALFHCQQALLLDQPASYRSRSRSQVDLADASPTGGELLSIFDSVKNQIEG